jgi:hypothetical protein
LEPAEQLVQAAELVLPELPLAVFAEQLVQAAELVLPTLAL